jgi:hypothetical protein
MRRYIVIEVVPPAEVPTLVPVVAVEFDADVAVEACDPVDAPGVSAGFGGEATVRSARTISFSTKLATSSRDSSLT